jgi:hypothetical protein
MAMGLGGEPKKRPAPQPHRTRRGARGRAHEAPAHRTHRTGHGTAAHVDDLDPAAAAAPATGTARAAPHPRPHHSTRVRVPPVRSGTSGQCAPEATVGIPTRSKSKH